jgi:pimeloyl-ACP methyl ester carboxylesterase
MGEKGLFFFKKGESTEMKLEVVVQRPAGSCHPTPLLFVHGYWHAAWCWKEHFLPYFAQRGFTAYALSLRGHGASEGHERLRWTSVADYADDMRQAIGELSSPPVLVGHSLGGLIVQRYLESESVPAAVLMASVPPQGVLRSTLKAMLRHPLAFTKSNLTMSPIHSVGTPTLAQEAFFSSDIGQENLSKYFAQIQNDSYRAYLDMMLFSLPRPKLVKTPMLVLGAANDTFFTAKEIKATAQAYDTKAEIFPNMAHDMMLDPGWQRVADRIAGWLAEKGM